MLPVVSRDGRPPSGDRPETHQDDGFEYRGDLEQEDFKDGGLDDPSDAPASSGTPLLPPQQHPTNTMRRSRRRRKVSKRRKAAANKDFKLVSLPHVHKTFTSEPRPPTLQSFSTASTAWLFDSTAKRSASHHAHSTDTLGSASLHLASPPPYAGHGSTASPAAPGSGAAPSPRLDIDVMKAIVHREGLVRSVKDRSRELLALSRAQRPIDEHVKGMLDVLLQLREATVAVVEAVVAWRWREVMRRRAAGMTADGLAEATEFPVFVWNRVDYAHKLCNDLDFLGNSEPLVAALRISPAMLRANPFMLPTNLADRAVELAHTGSQGMTLGDAEHRLLSTSANAAVRAVLGSGGPLGQSAAAAAVSLEHLPPIDAAAAGESHATAPDLAAVEARLRAAEVVVLHHLAEKAGDKGLGTKLDGGSMSSFTASQVLEPLPASAATAAAPWDPSRDSFGYTGDADDEHGSGFNAGTATGVHGGDGRADGTDDAVDGGTPAPAFDVTTPLGLPQTFTASDIDPVVLSASVAESYDAPDGGDEQFKGLAHALMQASSIYTDPTDVSRAHDRRRAAEAVARSMSPGRSAGPRVAAPTHTRRPGAAGGGRRAGAGTAAPVAGSRGRRRSTSKGRAHARHKATGGAQLASAASTGNLADDERDKQPRQRAGTKASPAAVDPAAGKAKAKASGKPRGRSTRRRRRGRGAGSGGGKAGGRRQSAAGRAGGAAEDAAGFDATGLADAEAAPAVRRSPSPSLDADDGNDVPLPAVAPMPLAGVVTVASPPPVTADPDDDAASDSKLQADAPTPTPTAGGSQDARGADDESKLVDDDADTHHDNDDAVPETPAAGSESKAAPGDSEDHVDGPAASIQDHKEAEEAAAKEEDAAPPSPAPLTVQPYRRVVVCDGVRLLVRLASCGPSMLRVTATEPRTGYTGATSADVSAFDDADAAVSHVFAHVHAAVVGSQLAVTLT